MAIFIKFTYQIFVHQFFKNSQYTANGERWPFFRVFMWAFPVIGDSPWTGATGNFWTSNSGI